MAFTNLFKGSSLAPGSAEFKRLMGLAADDNARLAAGDDDDEIILVSKADYKRKTGIDIKSVLAGLADSPAAAAPAATAPAATAPPAAGGVVVVNPLLDLDLVPVRPGDLITAASYNALIAACASLHMRLSILEARSGQTPPPPAGTGGTPPKDPIRTSTNLKDAFIATETSGRISRTAIFARGSGLASVSEAVLVYLDINNRQLATSELKERRANDSSMVLEVPRRPKGATGVVAMELRVKGPDGQDAVKVMEPPGQLRLDLEAQMMGSGRPVDVLDVLPALYKRAGYTG